MKPASATRRGLKTSISLASALSNASREANLRCSTTRVAMPCARANSNPCAPATLLITAETGNPASTSARRLLPRPEMSTTTDISEHPPRAPAVVLEQRQHALVAVEMQRAERHEGAAAA